MFTYSNCSKKKEVSNRMYICNHKVYIYRTSLYVIMIIDVCSQNITLNINLQVPVYMRWNRRGLLVEALFRIYTDIYFYYIKETFALISTNYIANAAWMDLPVDNLIANLHASTELTLQIDFQSFFIYRAAFLLLVIFF